MPQLALASYGNYNSVLIGDRAAGMGGAYTALSDDPAACSFYNPATLSRMKGSTLSAAVNIYKKFDTNYGKNTDFLKAPLRINRGTIVPVPSSSGSVYNFQNFAIALSIVFPDFDYYTGEIRSKTNETSFLSYRDESLWVGGSIALNITSRSSLGLTMYYVSQTFNRSLTDQYTDGGDTINISEEKTISNNHLIYLLGYYYKINPNWSFGTSLRTASLKVASRGTYFKTRLGTVSGVSPTVNISNLKSETRIPSKISLGIAYDEPRKQTISFDVSFYDSERYVDITETVAQDIYNHKPTLNAAIGYEKHLKDWLSLRLGAYTNFSSFEDIPNNPTRRYGDHINMWGFSTNFGIHTSNKTTITLGGYYNGGEGESTQQIGGGFQKIYKSIQVFSFLVATAFQF